MLEKIVCLMYIYLYRVFIFLLVAILFQNCQKKMLTKEEMVLINDYYDNRIYYIKEDIRLSAVEQLTKGTPVKIRLQTSSNLLKIKCYPIDESAEISKGRMISFVELDENQFSLKQEEVEKILLSKLSVVNPKKTTTNIKEESRIKSTKSKNKQKSM